MNKQQCKIVSFLKSIIKKAEGRGRTVKTMYCPMIFYAEIRKIKEYFEEFSMQDICEKGIFGKFMSIDICVNSKIIDKVFLSGDEFVIEKANPPQKLNMTKVEAFEYSKRNMQEIKGISKRFMDMIERTKCTEFEVSEVLDMGEKEHTPMTIKEGWFCYEANFDCEKPYIIVVNEEDPNEEEKILIPEQLAYYLRTHSCGSIKMRKAIQEGVVRNLQHKMKEFLGIE